MKYPFSVPTVYLINILISLTGNVNGQQKPYSYYNFPPLYNFDNYDACLKSKEETVPPTYCMVYAEVKPNESSELLQQMVQHYKEFPFRYKRDNLFFGVCLERCKNFSNTTAIDFSPEKDVIHNEITDYFGKVHKRPLDLQFRKEYHAQIHNCLDFEFQRKYNLSLRTYIEYCERSKENIQETEKQDILENLLYTFLGIILVLNILSSLYDLRLKLLQPEENQSNDFYKINPTTTVSKLLTSFSICRNYYRLIQPYFSDVSRDFQFLDCFRSIAMMLAVYGHTFVSQFQHISNPEYFEYSEENKYSIWILCTAPIIEIFFVMSGLFLCIKFQQINLIGPKTSWRRFVVTYVLLLVFRFIRFLPSVALLVLFNATILSRLQDGPFWRHITENIRTFSRENGWRNLLMVNNFSMKDTASHHTWFLAAIWQLYVLYLFVIMIVLKYPKIKKHIYTSLAVLSVLIPFLLSYWFKLQPLFVVRPETYRYTYLKDVDMYYKVYTPFYTKLSGYLVGIICGELYMKYTRTEEIRKIIRQPKVYLFTYLFIPTVAAIIISSSAVLEYSKPSFWTSLYASLHIIIWNVCICGLPLLGMSCNCGWIAYEFCCLPIFRFLSRLSFQVYIWHFTLIYLINGYQRQPYYVNGFYFFTQFIVIYTVSNIVAFLIALFVEYPLANCTQLLSSKGTPKNVKKSS